MWQLKTAIKVHLSIAQIKMESVTHFNPHLHIKEKKNIVSTVSIFGAFTFWPAYEQSCAFSKKLDHEKEKQQ